MSGMDECPDCGRDVLRTEKSRLPIVAFKKQMYDACFFDADNLSRSYRGNTVIAYHEEIDI